MTSADNHRAYPVTAILGGDGAELRGYFEHLRLVRERVKSGRLPGIATGLRAIDKKTGGLQNGIHLLAAEPGAGKTTLALQIARQAAMDGCSVVYLAFDEGGDRLALKLAAGAAGLSATEYLRGEKDVADIEAAMAQHHAVLSRIKIYSGPALSVADVAKMLEEHREIDSADEALLIVDFLQAWAGRMSRDDFRMAVTELIGQLRQVAIEQSVPVLCIAAQNRSGMGSDKMSSLRESSDLEYVADSISFLSTENGDDPQKRTVRFTCAKNRWGETFDIGLDFFPAFGQFTISRS